MMVLLFIFEVYATASFFIGRILRTISVDLKRVSELFVLRELM